MVSAGLGVIMNMQKGYQHFFDKHVEDVVSMAVHPNNKIIATGQKAAKGKAKLIDLYIWNVDT